jgi:hypothetical protein
MNYDELKHITLVLIGGKINTKTFIQVDGNALKNWYQDKDYITKVLYLHNSATRIKRDILSQNHDMRKFLGDKLKMLKTNCLVCQFNKTNAVSHEQKMSNF